MLLSYLVILVQVVLDMDQGTLAFIENGIESSVPGEYASFIKTSTLMAPCIHFNFDTIATVTVDNYVCE